MINHDCSAYPFTDIDVTLLPLLQTKTDQRLKYAWNTQYFSVNDVPIFWQHTVSLILQKRSGLEHAESHESSPVNDSTLSHTAEEQDDVITGEESLHDSNDTPSNETILIGMYQQ